MTPTLDEMEALDKARTQGAWHSEDNKDGYQWIKSDENSIAQIYPDWPDADFIAACSTFVPWAIARIKELEKHRLKNTEDLNWGIPEGCPIVRTSKED